MWTQKENASSTAAGCPDLAAITGEKGNGELEEERSLSPIGARAPAVYLLKVDGPDLAALKEMVGEEGETGNGEPGEEKSPTSPSPFSPSALLLTEAGVMLALTKTSKPAGKRLRKVRKLA